MLTLILGGARSGKSTYAEKMAADGGQRVTYLATAQAFDEEMAARIAKHQSERPANWRTVECPFDVADAIRDVADDTDCYLLDCMTLYVSNIILADENTADDSVKKVVEDIITAYQASGKDLIIVSNEVGLGLVPEYPLGRIYRDCLGRANQRLAAAADKVLFLIAGLAVDIKALAVNLGD